MLLAAKTIFKELLHAVLKAIQAHKISVKLRKPFLI
uniref:Uncharacterized protein n=1 Tax=Anguilla anguilla TaxID=7936 RepID=A0A0E9XV06_ANGAN